MDGDTKATTQASTGGCPVAHSDITIKGDETRVDARIRNNPFPFYRALREQKPVYYDPGMDTWLVTRYEDVKAVLLNNEDYSLEHGYQDRYAYGFVEELEEILKRE